MAKTTNVFTAKCRLPRLLVGNITVKQNYLQGLFTSFIPGEWQAITGEGQHPAPDGP